MTRFIHDQFPKDYDERELIMRLAPLYQQDIERAIEQGTQQGIERGIERGIQQGQRSIVENLLRTRFGELDAELSGIVEAILKLSPEEFAPLLLQLSNLSREELLGRFNA